MFADYLAQAPWDTIEKLEAYAQERSLSMLDVAIGGLAAKPTVASVIAGATTPEQVRANAAAAALDSDRDDLAQLDRAIATQVASSQRKASAALRPAVTPR